jgi:hypothetical protein
MSRFRRKFAGWFAVLIVWFFLANLAGVVRPSGLKPFKTAGFPFTVAAWGFGIEGGFDWSALALDAAIALVTSSVVALICARAAAVRDNSVGSWEKPA